MKKLVIGLAVASLIVPLGFAASAMADSSPAQQVQQFVSKYQQNLTTENGLLAKAQASSTTNVQVAALSQTVTMLNQSIAGMYADFQSLLTARTNLSQLKSSANSSGLTGAEKSIDNKINQINKELENLNKGKKGKDNKHKGLYQQLIKDRNDLEKSKKLMQVKIPKVDQAEWNGHPFNGGIPNLEKTILSLQNSVIHYTKLWIAQANPGSNTVTGSVYNSVYSNQDS